MTKAKKTETDHIEQARKKLVSAALAHVDFDGWSQTTFDAAVKDSKVDQGLAHQACPRGAVDLALCFHRFGDRQMEQSLANTTLSDMRFRDKVAKAVWLRINATADHKEAVRRGISLFSLPQYAGDGAQALWGTADRIWTALGDNSQDINWYTKRATLSAVYSATVLFWLGDESEGFADTHDFLDRRIDNVMQFEKTKSTLKANPIIQGIINLMPDIKKPTMSAPDDLPGKKETP